MELNEYARSLLGATTLAQKLQPLPTLTDLTPGRAEDWDIPSRPDGLYFAKDRQKLYFNLQDAHSRGLTLHSFANHELLATELMAWAILRFPDAPTAFRRGLIRELAEEQHHLSLYLARMSVGNVYFGELPVNDFFWKSCTSASTPLDFITRLALVFEQANLDFAQYYREAFAQAGDIETAAVLDRVFEDEVGHVRFGLHWFRQWKEPAQSDWDSFEGRLHGALGPTRAKGPVFDRKTREQIGFDPDFIERLDLWSRSKGRPPNVWAMNACCEDEVARGTPGYHPPARLQELSDDLAPILVFLARREDVVLARGGSTWLRQVREAGFALPELVGELRELDGRIVGKKQPWGWSPTMASKLSEPWRPELALAFGKDLAVELRKELGLPFCAPLLGAVCKSATEVRAALGEIAGNTVIKARFKSSGRGVWRGSAGEVPDGKWEKWLANVLAQQGCVVVEPWLDKVVDLSFHFDVDVAGKYRFLGLVHFENNEAGQFVGAWTHRHQLPGEIRRFLHGDGRDTRRVSRIAELLGQVVATRLHALGYSGPVGVDALVYRDQTGLVLQPMVEINPRFTMGRVALTLAARVHPLSNGYLTLLPCEQLVGLEPVGMRDNLLASGDFLLADPAFAKRIVPVLRMRGSTA